MSYFDPSPVSATALPSWLTWISRSEPALAISVGLLVVSIASLVGLPILLVRIPSDYLIRSPQTVPSGSLRWLGRLAKNVLGGVLLILGVLMLVLPGQGILTLVGALVLLDFPGKRRVERWLILRPKVLSTINALRARAGRSPLQT